MEEKPADNIEDIYKPAAHEPQACQQLIVLSGCSSGGKSTLLTELGHRGLTCYPEAGRQIAREQLHLGGTALPWVDSEQFLHLAISRALFFYNSANPSAGPVVFDRSIVDTICGLGRMLGSIPVHYQHALATYRYATTVYLTPPWEALFVQDAERKSSFAKAAAQYEALLQDYPAHGYKVVEIPRLSVAERADFLIEALAALHASRKVV